jgi:N-sulfoglucosamine sulfohydrolase
VFWISFLRRTWHLAAMNDLSGAHHLNFPADNKDVTRRCRARGSGGEDRGEGKSALYFIQVSSIRSFVFCVAFVIFLQTALFAASKPNLILFVADDHMFSDCGAYGAKDVKTPNIDRLAREGLLFRNAFAASPTCMPSRSAMFTGLMPMRNGAHANNLGDQSRCKANIRSLPMYLKELGYRVAQAGKTHFGPKEVFTFERIEKSEVPEPGFEKNTGLHMDLNTEVVDEWLGKVAKDQPFCLIVCDHSPHVIWPRPPTYDPASVTVPPNHIDTPGLRMSRARYYTDIAKMDTNLGRVLSSVEKHGFAENSLFIYTADQGAQWPLAKWNVYDQGIHVPLIARWPGKLTASGETAAMISLIDLLPTFIEIAGGKAPDDLDGKSFLPLLEGKTKTHRDVIFSTHSQDGAMNRTPMRCVRSSRYKYILNLAPEIEYTTHIDLAKDHDGGREYWPQWEEAAKTDPRAAAILKRYHWRPKEELYDLAFDPYEMHNLAEDGAYADLKRDLSEKLVSWRKQQSDTKTGPDPVPEK